MSSEYRSVFDESPSLSNKRLDAVERSFREEFYPEGQDEIPLEEFKTLLKYSVGVESKVPLTVWDEDAPPRTRFFRLWRKPRMEEKLTVFGEDVLNEFEQIPEYWEIQDPQVSIEYEDSMLSYEAVVPVYREKEVKGRPHPINRELSYSGELPVHQIAADDETYF